MREAQFALYKLNELTDHCYKKKGKNFFPRERTEKSYSSFQVANRMQEIQKHSSHKS